MSTYFLDTSAVVKRYFLEQGHDWIVEKLNIENPNNY